MKGAPRGTCKVQSSTEETDSTWLEVARARSRQPTLVQELKRWEPRTITLLKEQYFASTGDKDDALFAAVETFARSTMGDVAVAPRQLSYDLIW